MKRFEQLASNLEQVLGEIGRPHKTFPTGSAIGVTIVYVLYILVNISYVSFWTKSKTRANALLDDCRAES